jgi:hypothetical protein
MTMANTVEPLDAGLPLRARFAARALQGILANPNIEPDNEYAPELARHALRYADALIERLAEGDDATK